MGLVAVGLAPHHEVIGRQVDQVWVVSGAVDHVEAWEATHEVVGVHGGHELKRNLPCVDLLGMCGVCRVLLLMLLR